MKTVVGCAPRGAIGDRRDQGGIALVVALIVLAAMSLAAAALMRAVDTTVAVSGNLGFREASIPPVNMAVEEAFAALFENDLLADRDRDLPAQNYYGSLQPGEDVRGVPFVLQEPRNYPVAARVLDAGDGNTLRYIIERMCLRPGPTTPAHCALAKPHAPSAPATPASDTVAPTISFFRVTVRVDGPRNTVSHVQAMLRDSTPPQRTAWRILTE